MPKVCFDANEDNLFCAVDVFIKSVGVVVTVYSSSRLLNFKLPSQLIS